LIILVAVLLVVVESPVAHATFLPPSTRLPILFQRAPWQRLDEAPIPIPPGHIAERWER
jgi:hypothetical protein